MSIYKNKETKIAIQELYYEKLNSLKIEYQEIDVNTKYGRTRVIKTGKSNGTKIIVFHGMNTGAPVALEAIKELTDSYNIFAIDTIGQATQSEETRVNIKDNSFALWADEVLEKLQIKTANFIGVSYGGFILQKLISHKPERVSKCIFVVPAGLVDGAFFPSLTKVTFPLIKFLLTKNDNHLHNFLSKFINEDDNFMFRLQKAMLLGVKMDYRRPPILKIKDVMHFEKPVYLMTVDNDIFFPGNESIKKAQNIFKNLQDIYILENNKHMPNKKQYPEIQQKIREWISK